MSVPFEGAVIVARGEPSAALIRTESRTMQAGVLQPAQAPVPMDFALLKLSENV